MDILLADAPMPILEGVGLVVVSIGLILASVARIRAQRPGSRVAHIYWHDASQAGYVWATATIVVLAGALGEVEGLRAPIWLLLSIVAGMAGLVIARLRWIRHAARAGRPSNGDSGRPEQPRLVSTSWEVAFLGASAGGLIVYGASLSHEWGHPVHWLIAGIGVAIGYAIGLVAATPRFTVRRSGR